MLDLAALDRAVMVDRREWPDIGVDDSRLLADDRRAADRAVDDFGAFLDDHLADQLRVAVDIALDRGGHLFEDQPVGLQYIVLLAGVDPPALMDIREDLAAVLDQPLDRVGDLQLAAPGWLDPL